MLTDHRSSKLVKSEEGARLQNELWDETQGLLRKYVPAEKLDVF